MNKISKKTNKLCFVVNYISSKRQKQNRRKESAKIRINAKLIRQKKNRSSEFRHNRSSGDLLSLNMLKGFTYPFTDNFNRHLYVL